MTDLASELRGRDADVLIEVASERGATWAELSAHTSSQGQNWRPMCVSSQSDFLQLLENASRRFPQSDLALCWGRRVGLQALSSVGAVVMSSPTVKDATDIALKLHHLLQTLFTFDYVIEGEEVHFRIVFPDELRLQPTSSFHAECLLAIGVASLSAMLGRDARATRFYSPQFFCGEHGRYRELLADQVVHAEGHYRLAFPAAMLSEAGLSRNRALEQENRRAFEAALQVRQNPKPISNDVMSVLQRDPEVTPSLQGMASQLGVPVRRLRRRLDAESLTYRELVQRVRSSYAEQLLMQDSQTVDAVSRALGFADTANFRKAFKQWTGLSPSEWRRQHQRQTRTD